MPRPEAAKLAPNRDPATKIRGRIFHQVQVDEGDGREQRRVDHHLVADVHLDSKLRPGGDACPRRPC